MEKIKIIVLTLCFLLIAFPAFGASVWVEPVEVEQPVMILTPEVATLSGEESSGGAVAYALTSTVYDDGMISNTYLEWARGLLPYVPFGKDYVFARTGQYQYIFAVGDFSEGFSDSQAEIYQLDLSSGYNDTYSYMNYVDSFRLSVNGGLVYSNVAPYPTLKGGDFSYEILFGISFAFALFGIWSIIRHVPIFGRG